MSSRCPLVNPATGKQCSKYRDGTRRTCSMHRYRMKHGRDLWVKRSKKELAEIQRGHSQMSCEEVDRLLATIDHVLVGEYVNSRTQVTAQHTCGRINRVTIAAIKQGHAKHGCITCAKKNGKLLALTHGEAVKQMKAYGFTPIEKYRGTNKAWRSIHDECGEEVAPSLINLKQTTTKGTSGCSHCKFRASADKRRATPGDVAESLAKQNLYPVGEYVRSSDPFQVGCAVCNRDDLMMTFSDIQQGHGCRYCNGGLFTMSPSFVYLVKHTQKNTLKVGIARQGATGRRRLGQHVRCGFSLVSTWEFDTGELAYNVEQEVLRHWREDLGAHFTFTSEDMPRNAGHTETASMRKVGLKRTIDYINGRAAA